MRKRTALASILVGILACASIELPDLGPAPAFGLIDQNQRPVSPETLAGRVWVANFIFTSCPDICPILTRTMAGMQRDLSRHGDAVGFVSFSVDPVVDTPAVLKAYATLHGADESTWSFLTGPESEVKEVVVAGFKQSLEAVPARDGEPRNILHGSHFVLVDQAGTIRGFYASKGDGPVALVRHAEALLDRAPDTVRKG